jgi:excisionase family DNA binding protein
VTNQLLRVGEFAAAVNIKESTARAWILSRRLSFVRVGRRAIRIPASEVERIVAEGTVPAREERHAGR